MVSYSLATVASNKGADQTKLGVKLGAVCIAQAVPVAEVAQAIGVSRAIVYRWFSGRSAVSRHLQDKVQTYYRSRLPEIAG